MSTELDQLKRDNAALREQVAYLKEANVEANAAWVDHLEKFHQDCDHRGNDELAAFGEWLGEGKS